MYNVHISQQFKLILGPVWWTKQIEVMDHASSLSASLFLFSFNKKEIIKIPSHWLLHSLPLWLISWIRAISIMLDFICHFMHFIVLLSMLTYLFYCRHISGVCPCVLVFNQCNFLLLYTNAHQEQQFDSFPISVMVQGRKTTTRTSSIFSCVCGAAERLKRKQRESKHIKTEMKNRIQDGGIAPTHCKHCGASFYTELQDRNIQ